jgi:hypothetical protein
MKFEAVYLTKPVIVTTISRMYIHSLIISPNLSPWFDSGDLVYGSELQITTWHPVGLSSSVYYSQQAKHTPDDFVTPAEG